MGALLERQASVAALVYEVDPRSDLYRSGDIDRVSAVHGELEDYLTLAKALDEHRVETVFHLGAQPLVEAAHRLPLQTFEANIRGTYNLLEACRRGAHASPAARQGTRCVAGGARVLGGRRAPSCRPWPSPSTSPLVFSSGCCGSTSDGQLDSHNRWAEPSTLILDVDYGWEIFDVKHKSILVVKKNAHRHHTQPRVLFQV